MAFATGSPVKSFLIKHETTVAPNSVATKVVEAVHIALTESGRTELSLYKHYYDPSSEEFQFIEGYVKTNGKIVPIDPATIRHDQISGSATGVSVTTKVTIPANNMAIRSQLHLKYRIVQKPPIYNMFSAIVPLTTEELAKQEVYRFVSERPFKFHLTGVDGFFAATESRENGKYVVEVRPTSKAYNLEGLEIRRGSFSITTSPNWKAVNTSVAPYYQKVALEALPPALTIVVEEAKKLTSKKEMIEYVAREINKLVAYSGDWTTIHGQRFPAGLEKTISTGKGDCKDYSTIMVAVLRQLGFSAYPFLTFRTRTYLGPQKLNVAMRTPTPLAFNHVIVWARDGDKKEWWIDPTNPLVIADVITSDILGNFGLRLDGKSDFVITIPERNATAADTVIEQNLTIAPDNSVRGSGTIKMSPSAYNMIAMFQRSSGRDVMSDNMSRLLNPRSKTLVEVQKKDPKSADFTFRYIAHDWMLDKEKRIKALVLYAPLAEIQTKIAKNGASDLGEPGSTKWITTIASQKALDPIQDSCVVRSEWFDYDRYVENHSAGVTVTDIVTVKKRHVSDAEVVSAPYRTFKNDFEYCAFGNNKIVFHLDDSHKTAEDKERELARGVPFDVMTDSDAQALLRANNPKDRYYRNLKAYRYYEKKMRDESMRDVALIGMAEAIAEFGYIRDDKYDRSFALAALTHLQQASSSTDTDILAKVHYLRMRNYLRIYDFNNAQVAYYELKKIDTKSLNYYRAAHFITLRQKNWLLAERWLRASEPLAKTEADKIDFYEQMAAYLEGHQRVAESRKYREILVSKKPKSVWAWHNLALTYYPDRNWDKLIEYEKKAQEIEEFAEGRRTLSQIYYLKAGAVQKVKELPDRTVATSSEYEDLLLESVKYDGKNVPTLLALASYYLKGEGNADKTRFSEGYSYAKRALDIAPDNPYAANMVNQFRNREN